MEVQQCSRQQVLLKSKQVTFDELPDELVVLIFLYLSPEDLACHVSHVCLRWQSIAKDPILWESSILHYDESYQLQFQKIINFAPSLSKLEINMFKHMNDATLQSIMSGCISVKYLSFYPSTSVSVHARLSILNRFCKSLEGLNIFIDDSYLLSVKTSEAFTKILNCMDELKELTLRGFITHYFLKHDLFKSGLKNLKMLDIGGLTVTPSALGADSSIAWQNFIFSIVECRATTLKKLSLPSGVFSFSTISLIEDKFRLSSIEDLKTCEVGIWAVKRLDSLERLHIIGMTQKELDCLRKDVQSSTTLQYNVVFDWINSIPQFLRIKNLVLENISDDERNIIPHLLNSCRNLDGLTLYSSCHSAAQLFAIILLLPPLKYLSIHRMPCLRSRHLDLLVSHLPSLTVLNLRHNSLTDGILQYYTDYIQTKMPNLQLQCDWGYWDINGGQKWIDLRPSYLLQKQESVKSHPSSSCDLSPDERLKIRLMLEATNEYEDDD